MRERLRKAPSRQLHSDPLMQSLVETLSRPIRRPQHQRQMRKPQPNDQEFYWRVRGTDYWGKSTSWSEVRSLRSHIPFLILL